MLGGARSNLDQIAIELEALAAPQDVEAVEAIELRLTRLNELIREHPWGDYSTALETVPKRTQTRLRAVRGDIHQLLAQASVITAPRDPTEALQVNEIREAVERASAGLDGLVGQARRSGRRRQLAVTSLVVLPSAVIALIAFFLHWQSRIEGVSASILFPQVYSLSRDGNDVVKDRPSNAFMLEFSKFYFKRPNDFAQLLFEREPGSLFFDLPPIEVPEAPMAPDPSASNSRRTRAISVSVRKQEELPPRPIVTTEFEPTDPLPPRRVLLKCMLQNRSMIQQEFISSISVRLRLAKATAFPWDRLVTTTAIDSIPSSSGFLLNNTGIGPALDVNWAIVTDSGLVLNDGQIPVMEFKKEIDFPWPGEPVSPRGIRTKFYRGLRNDLAGTFYDIEMPDMVPSVGTMLSDEMFLVLNENPEEEKPEIFFEHEGIWYETIRTLERLAELTRVVHDEPFNLRVEYECLRGKRYAVSYTGDLPEDTCWYVRRAGLLEYDPRDSVTATYKVVKMVPELRSVLEKLATYFEPPPLMPEGVNLVRHDIEIDCAGLGVDEVRSQTIASDTLLNPRGHVLLYTSLWDPRNGAYEVSVEVNGKAAQTFAFVAVVPDQWRFPDRAREQEEEIERLREYFRSKAQ